MRYVIVSVVKGEAGDFNNELRKEVYEKFKARSSCLPAHFTIKAPFEYDGNIEDMEKVLEEFAQDAKAKPYKISGFEHFDDRVIYMDVKMSKEAKKIHDKLIDKLSILPYIKFNKKDGKDKVFHVTITSKKLPPKFKDVWQYVNEFECEYSCIFDNITIYVWKNNTWKLHKEYILRE